MNISSCTDNIKGRFRNGAAFYGVVNQGEEASLTGAVPWGKFQVFLH